MNGTSQLDPSRRQVLVNLGNRFVVFGSDAGLPEPLRFNPNESPIFPRVSDESEVAEQRIVETLQVTGLTRLDPHPTTNGSTDVELVDASGKRTFVEIKVRERDPKQREFQHGREILESLKSKGENLEIWFFNIERLKLTVMRLDGHTLRIDELVPLDVWEKSTEGVFERQRVVDEVADWIVRIDRFYSTVREWLGENKHLRFDESRTITMSEEMMQEFAVADRELKVLDVLRGEEVEASFVPRGLWLVGAWGRIDIITKEKTSAVVAIKKDEKLEWHTASLDDRRKLQPFTKSALLQLIGAQ